MVGLSISRHILSARVRVCARGTISADGLLAMGPRPQATELGRARPLQGSSHSIPTPANHSMMGVFRLC
jgi:hypothetical protein